MTPSKEEIRRYFVTKAVEHPEGEWVFYGNVAPLEERVKELEALINDDWTASRAKARIEELLHQVEKLEADIRSCSAWSAHLQMDLETSGEIIKELEAENRELSGQVVDLSIAVGKEKAENQALKKQLGIIPAMESGICNNEQEQRMIKPTLDTCIHGKKLLFDCPECQRDAQLEGR